MTENLNIEKFNPKKAELVAFAKECSELVIKGVDDIEGYNLVDEKRKEAKRAKSNIKNTGMSMRRDAIDFQKAVLTVETDLLKIIEPVEKELEAKQEAIDHEKLIIKRKEQLPEREEKLKAVKAIYIAEGILEMDDNQFTAFLNEHTALFLAEQQQKIDQEKAEIEAKRIKDEEVKAEAARLAKEKKEAEELEKKRQAEIESAKKKAAEDAVKKAEQDKKDALAKAEQDKQEEIKKIRDEQEAQEKARIAKEVEDRIKKEKEEAAIKAEQDRVEKNKKYLDFLKKNGCQGEGDNNFIISRFGNKVSLYKKVDETEI